MEALSGPVLVLTSLLALAGCFKLWRPAPTAGALRAVGLPGRLGLVRVLGTAEVVLGASALVTAARPLLALSAAAYIGFAGFVCVALVSGAPVQSCGCFGRRETPPSSVHVVVDVAAAATLLAAAAGDMSAPSSVLADQPWWGAPFALLVATSVVLTYLVLTTLPAVLSPARR